MKIFLVRHGIAQATAPSGRDEDRRLTERGRSQVHTIAKALKLLNVQPDRILASPYPRAAETAQIIATTLGLTDHLKTFDLLRYGHGIEHEIHSLLNPNESSLMLVGHEPDMSTLIGTLAGTGTAVRFQKRRYMPD